ncbi:hypothetical protein QFC24_003800 [Naganishia onofrii]|uniref:Uncharacterized protein n=1 Tax=Naganishia onofrii TaxID=1851511 RepID=A0ACC2XJN1_9TREE|nr:hypothetical protein QFC24_003800 [Naganishia onofrii]
MDADAMFSMLQGGSSKKSKAAKSASKRRRQESTPSDDDTSPPDAKVTKEEDEESSRRKRSKRLEDDTPANVSEKDPMAALESDGGDVTMGDITARTIDPDDSLAQDDDEDAEGVIARAETITKRLPIVTDDFEQEAEREVAATSGFAKVEEGEKMKLVHQVRHQVALPKDYPYIPISSHVPNDPPVRTYKFTLDPFQRVAVNSIERNESVLVSAHTSAGKTVVAEYAIATCLKEKKRVVYTSPIKALSNQKFRELQAEFQDVGLMTGDVTINPTASCLVMTTEILRSMLYRGSEVMREVAWVVFDEIHYMRDKERGVVWEETIILLPDTVRYVFLSATIPNSMQFAEWICELHNQPCHVVYTDFRPTPLQHYMFPEGGDGMYLVVDEKSVFREDNFQKAMGSLADKGEDPANPSSGRGRNGNTRKGGAMKGPNSDIYKLVKMIMMKNLNPVIVFAFSKRECESLAMQMAKIDMNTEEEAAMVENIFTNAMNNLNEDDRNLPQIGHILPLLKRGIGVHHGGLLPILKEVIEILFQEGLIKVLFATETFSIGLNMPAKTVVFTSVQKFDGKEFRHLSGGEYIQMSGRAGRRGLDARGIVIMMCGTKLEPDAAKGMVKGQADRLDSAFHLGYNMVLNLMRVEGISPEYMLQRCFYQFQNTMNVPVLEEELKQLESQKKATKIEKREEVEEYYDLRQHLDDYAKDYRAVIQLPTYSLPFLQPGRLVQVRDGDRDFGWGAVIHFEKRNWPMIKGNRSRPADVREQDDYVVMVMLNCAMQSRVDNKNKSEAIHSIQPAFSDDSGEPIVVPVLLSCIHAISHIRVFLGKDLRSLPSRKDAWKGIMQVKKKYPGGIPHLDPKENMGITDERFVKLVEKISKLEKKLGSLPITSSPELPKLYDAYFEYVSLKTKIKDVKKRITAVQNVLQLDELKNRKRVLRRLGFTSAEDIIETKGRVACEISTGDELMLTEMIFSGLFNDLTPAQCAAICSCFVFDEKSEAVVKLRETLAQPLRRMQEIARRIATVSTECKIPLVPDEYVQSFKMELMDAVFKWCGGATFSEICKMTDIFEGSIIRSFRRLQELLRQMGGAARAIGNPDLETKFEDAIKLLERPNTVVFNPSLYL